MVVAHSASALNMFSIGFAYYKSICVKNEKAKAKKKTKKTKKLKKKNLFGEKSGRRGD